MEVGFKVVHKQKVESWQDEAIVAEDLGDDELGDLGFAEVTLDPVAYGPLGKAAGVLGEVLSFKHKDK